VRDHVKPSPGLSINMYRSSVLKAEQNMFGLVGQRDAIDIILDAPISD
jgi:hypothetical protein